MSNTILNTFYQNLVTKLRNGFVFYIPKAIFDEETLNIFKQDKSLSLLLDNVLVVEQRNGAFLFDYQEHISKCIRKHEELTEIIFLLLEKKNELQDFQLAFILDKYFEQASLFFKITYWLSLNVDKLDNDGFKFKGLFTKQHENYKQHLEEYIRNFYPDKAHIPDDKLNLLHLIKVNFKEITNTTFNNIVLPEKSKNVFTKLIDEKQTAINQNNSKNSIQY